MNWRIWLKGLIGAIIGGVSNGILMIAIDPLNFNLTTGLKNLGSVAVGSAIISAALYLKQSPIPKS